MGLIVALVVILRGLRQLLRFSLEHRVTSELCVRSPSIVKTGTTYSRRLHSDRQMAPRSPPTVWSSEAEEEKLSEDTSWQSRQRWDRWTHSRDKRLALVPGSASDAAHSMRLWSYKVQQKVLKHLQLLAKCEICGYQVWSTTYSEHGGEWRSRIYLDRSLEKLQSLWIVTVVLDSAVNSNVDLFVRKITGKDDLWGTWYSMFK